VVGTTQHELPVERTPIRVILVMEIGSCFQAKTDAELAKAKKTRNVKRIQKKITKFAITVDDLQIIKM